MADRDDDQKYPSFAEYLQFRQEKTIFGEMIFVEEDQGNIIWSFECIILKTKGEGENLCHLLSVSVQEEGLGYGYHNVGSGEFKYYPNREEGIFEGRLKDKYDDGFELSMEQILPQFFEEYPGKC